MDGHKPHYRLSVEEALDDLRSSSDGLSASEATDRLNVIGPNILDHHRSTPVAAIFVRQFKSLLVLLLLASAGVALYLHNFKTASIMLAIAVLNTLIGFFQEYKAENLLESLERLATPRAKVLQKGKITEVDARELIPGDIIYIEAGDSIPADARVISETELATNDFALTGESEPTRKFTHALSADVPLHARHNMLYMGTTVATGNGRAVVTSTGMHTELGRIVRLSAAAHVDVSPLQREMNSLASRIAIATVVLAALLTIFELRADLPMKTALLFGISIAAAMIPNGLVAEVSLALAQASTRLFHKKTLVKKLSAVETLGATSVILTDKTGTLTRNEMTAVHILVGHSEYAVDGTGYEANGAVLGKTGKPLPGKDLHALQLFFETGVLASNAVVNPPDAAHPDWFVVGDPTEGALITLARKAGLDPDTLSAQLPEAREYAFDEARQLMTSVREYNGQLYAFVKGAPERVLEHAEQLWDHGHVRALTAADRAALLAYHETHAANAERNLMFAYRVLPKNFDTGTHEAEVVEQKLTILGIVSLHDPLRADVPRAMAAAARADIKVSIVTGDSPGTALAIARQAGLNDGAITLVTAAELHTLTEGQLASLLLSGGAVFSRVNPEDKLRLVEIAKAGRRITAVTGDGINDAPALKRADIGVAMGRTGTDVAKEAAEIVLLDDSFATLMNAVEQGRLTFANIKNAARCALTDNMSELIAVLISLVVTTIWHIPAAITAIQILAIDIAAQMLPITALGMDPAQKRLMRQKPRDPRAHILNRKTAIEFIAFGTLAASLAYGNYLWYFLRHHISPVHLSTITGPYLNASILTFATIVGCQFMNLLLVRSGTQDLISKRLWDNKHLLGSFALAILLIIVIVYSPLVQPYFGSGSLGLQDWLTVILVAIIYTLVRKLHLHTRKHSSKNLIKKHGPEKVRAHLQKRYAR